MIKPLINQNHSLGHPAIDADHAVIGTLWLRAVSSGHLEFPLRVARLRKAMTGHFEHEAALLANAGRRLCPGHQEEHDLLLRMCTDALDLYRHDWRKTRSLLRNDFARKMREHIVSMDQCAVLILHTAPSSIPCDHLTTG